MVRTSQNRLSLAGGLETPAMGAWAVAIIEPNRDEEAERSLKRHGFRVVFLYYQRLLKGHRGRWRTASDFVPTPLFPGYGFVELHPDQAWPHRTHTRIAAGPRVPGFLEFARAGADMLWLGEATVWAWKRRIELGDFDDKKLPPKMPGKAKFVPANSEDERQRALAELLDKMMPQHAVSA